MKNKAFTLIELLGVIVLLGIIVLVAFPPLLNQINKSKQGISEATKEIIIDAAKDYYENNKKEYKKIDGVSYCINVDALAQQNYLNEKIKDKDLNDIKTDNFVKLTYQNEKYKYEIVDECTKYTVTFDPNGGIVNKDTKEVIKGSKYGELPTPTREGYTFMGWNGKNMFLPPTNQKANTRHPNIDIEVNNGKYSINGIPKITEYQYYALDINDFNVKANYPNYLPYDSVSSNSLNAGNYTLSINKISGNIPPSMFRIVSYEKESSSERKKIAQLDFSTGELSNTFTLSENTEIYYALYFKEQNQLFEDIQFYIQLEEGDEATPYEPFYIEEDTNVVQEQDHTLKAIWKANE